MTPIIILSSAAYGSAEFKYDSDVGRVEGLLRLMATAEEQEDGIPREYFFNEMDDDGGFDEDKNAIVAKWNGEEWVVAEYGKPEIPRQKTRQRLILDVEYDLDGTSVEEIRGNLNDLVMRGINNGMLTGASPATVDDYNITILDLSDREKMDAVGVVLQDLLRDANELKSMKLEIHKDYTTEDIVGWEKRLHTAEMMIALLLHNRLDPQLLERAAKLSAINRPELAVQPTPAQEEPEEANSPQA